MALNLTKLFINLVATGQAVSAQSYRGRAEKRKSGVEVRTLAGGRRRAVKTPGEVVTYTCRLSLVSTTDKLTLISWQGALVQIRDNEGRIFTGVYEGLDIDERVNETTWDIGLTLTVVTAAEGV